MRHLPVGKRTVRKTAASVGEHQIGRQSFSEVAAFVRISDLRCHPKIGQMTQCKRAWTPYRCIDEACGYISNEYISTHADSW